MPNLGELKALNKTDFAYTDREIDLVNAARNEYVGYKYFQVEDANNNLVQTGILVGENNQPISDGKNIIIELPACNNLSDFSPIKDRLLEQLKNLNKAQIGNKKNVKFLFPYRKGLWHWNLGEITLEENDDAISINATAYDSYGRGTLESEIQGQIRKAFEDNYTNKTLVFSLSETSKNKSKVQTGVACGLYAARAMHNLKTNQGSDNIWEGIFDNSNKHKGEKALRDEDSVLVHNKKGENTKFCAPINEVNFVELNQLKGKDQISKEDKNKLDSLIKELRDLEEGDFNIVVDALKKCKSNNETDNRELLDKLFTNLEKADLQKIFFESGGGITRGTSLYTFEVLENIHLTPKKQKSATANTTEEEEEATNLIIETFFPFIRQIACENTESIVGDLGKKGDDLTKGAFEDLKTFLKERFKNNNTHLDHFIGFAEINLKEIAKEVDAIREERNKKNTQKKDPVETKGTGEILSGDDPKKVIPPTTTDDVSNSETDDVATKSRSFVSGNKKIIIGKLVPDGPNVITSQLANSPKNTSTQSDTTKNDLILKTTTSSTIPQYDPLQNRDDDNSPKNNDDQSNSSSSDATNKNLKDETKPTEEEKIKLESYLKKINDIQATKEESHKTDNTISLTAKTFFRKKPPTEAENAEGCKIPKTKVEDAKEITLKISEKEVKIGVYKDNRGKTYSIITPEIISLNSENNNDSKSFKKSYYSEFGAIKFSEATKASEDNSASKTGDASTPQPLNTNSTNKIFGNADLFMSSFRNCVFENVDFSQVKNFGTIGFCDCKFEGECVLPKGFKIEDFETKSFPPTPSPSRPTAETLHREAATKIQAAYRGHKERKFVQIAQKLREEKKNNQGSSHTTIP